MPKRAGRIILLLLVYFVICELFLRAFWEPADRKLYPYLKNPFLRFAYYPNNELIVPHMVDDNMTRVRTNAFGFRGSSMKTAKKDKGVYRIFFLGGSTVEQRHLPEEETFQKIIESRLNSRIENMRFECVNAGMSGAMTVDSVALLASEIIHYDPDMIIVMHAINDLVSGFNRDYSPLHRIPVGFSPPIKDIAAGLYKKSYLLIFLNRMAFDKAKNFFYPASERRGLEKLKAEWRKAPKRTYMTFPSIAEFKKNIKSLIGISGANNIRICFLTQPSLYSDSMTQEEKNAAWDWVKDDGTVASLSSYHDGMKAFNEEARAICGQNSVEYIELADKVPSDLRYFFDHVHYTPEGAELIAGVITDYLWENRSEFEPVL